MDGSTVCPRREPSRCPRAGTSSSSDLRDYLGLAWYAHEFYAPPGWLGQRIFLRVGSANYAAKVWVDGRLVGEHEGGHLPFAFDITDLVAWDRPNVVAIRVDAELTPTPRAAGQHPGRHRRLHGQLPERQLRLLPLRRHPRPVILYAVHATRIEDVTVVTEMDGADGIVRVHVVQAGGDLPGKVTLAGDGGSWEARLTFRDGAAEATLRVPDARLWGPDDPYLYKLTLTLDADGLIADRYTLDIGIRTVAVAGDKLLLNGQPILLKGFGKHEDFPVHGRGLNLPLIVKDAGLLKWIGANSFRTSHYPYSEEAMRMADREGFLVVDETPAVGLFFDDGAEGIAARLAQCRQQVDELIAHDKNHPCVIMWSVANEPMVGQGGFAAMMSGQGKLHTAAGPFFTELFELVRKLDPTRLVTVEAPIAGGFMIGWRNATCCASTATTVGTRRAASWRSGWRRWRKTWISFTSNTGSRSPSPSSARTRSPGCMASRPRCGPKNTRSRCWPASWTSPRRGPSWRGCTSGTSPTSRPARASCRAGGLNRKGVFTHDRQPKMAAHLLRERWGAS